MILLELWCVQRHRAFVTGWRLKWKYFTVVWVSLLCGRQCSGHQRVGRTGRVTETTHPTSPAQSQHGLSIQPWQHLLDWIVMRLWTPLSDPRQVLWWLNRRAPRAGKLSPFCVVCAMRHLRSRHRYRDIWTLIRESPRSGSDVGSVWKHLKAQPPRLCMWKNATCLLNRGTFSAQTKWRISSSVMHARRRRETCFSADGAHKHSQTVTTSKNTGKHTTFPNYFCVNGAPKLSQTRAISSVTQGRTLGKSPTSANSALRRLKRVLNWKAILQSTVVKKLSSVTNVPSPFPIDLVCSNTWSFTVVRKVTSVICVLQPFSCH